MDCLKAGKVKTVVSRPIQPFGVAGGDENSLHLVQLGLVADIEFVDQH